MGFSAMSSFLPVNTGMAAVDPVEHGKDVPVPLPPQPHPEVKTEPQIQEQKLVPITAPVSTAAEGNLRPMDGTPNTPQAPNPNGNVPSGENTGSREGSSTQSSAHDEAPAAESDGDHHCHSDNEAGMGNPSPPSKRKKGQRFFCTGYPPCNLSFTRSEHLARHIRKHTGERPFQCHCSRRFSRLDNLRQHAQTVHINEDIPGDSLAATGTRFQRQVRTDRVRQPGRARAGTTGGGGQTAHSRTHSRNLSTSSVTSNISAYGQSPEIRRRPPPLMMANDGTARARMSLEAMTSPPNTPPGQAHGFLGHSPGVQLYTGYSAGGPGDMGSPYYASPASTTSAFWPDRMAARRLSVPSGQRPFDSPHGATYPPGYVRQQMPTPVRYSGNGNSFASPTTGSQTPIDTPGLSPSEADLRRRTWHPSTYSGFPRPIRDSWPQQPAQRIHPEFPAVVPPSESPSRNQTTRLPGIESFDQYPLLPPPRQPTPMLVDRAPEVRTSTSISTATPAFAPSFSSQAPAQRPLPPFTGAGHRRGNLSIDTTLQRTLTNLDIHGTSSQRDATQWGQQTLGELQSIGSRPSTSSTYSQASNRQETIPGDQPSGHSQSQSSEFAQHWNNRVSADRPQNPTSLPFTRPENAGNDGINNSVEYNPDVTQGRTSSDGSQNSNVPSSTGDTPQNNGFPPTANPNTNPGFYSGAPSNDSGMDRLEALVAVATSEDKDKFR